MRILYFSQGYTEHDRRFLAELAQAGHDALFLRLDPTVSRESRPLPAGVREVEHRWRAAVRPEPAQCAAAAAEFADLVGELKPDLVHAGPVQTCGYIAALSGFRPWVLMSWGYDMLVDAERDREWKAATEFTVPRPDLFFCDCGAVARRAADFGCAADRVLSFPWGTDPDVFAPGPDTLRLRAARPGWSDSAVVLGVRSWEPGYGVKVLLEAFRLAHRADASLRLVLAGGGSEDHFVREFIEHNALDEAVWLCGRIPHPKLAPYYRAADLYVSCSYTDGASVSLLEAMSTGLPAVVSDIPGNREWVAHGVNGWLATAGAPDRFAEGMLAMAAAAPERRARMADYSRRLIQERADWRKNAPRLLAAYQRLFQERAA